MSFSDYSSLDPRDSISNRGSNPSGNVRILRDHSPHSYFSMPSRWAGDEDPRRSDAYARRHDLNARIDPDPHVFNRALTSPYNRELQHVVEPYLLSSDHQFTMHLLTTLPKGPELRDVMGVEAAL